MSETKRHPDEEELVLFLLGDESDQRAVAPHLDGCATCRDRVVRLRAILTASAGRPVPEPAAGFEDRVWERQRAALEAAGLLGDRPETEAPSNVVRPAFWSNRRVLGAAALAASLLLAFLLGLFLPPPGTEVVPSGPSPAAAGSGAADRVLLVAVGGHLERARIVLLEVANARGPAGILAQREPARDLLADNRLYRQTASLSGRPAVADLLDEIERVLLELAQAPETAGGEELEWLRTRIEDRDLLFKVKVIEGSARTGGGDSRTAGRDL